MSYREHFRELFPEIPEEVEYVAIDHLNQQIIAYRSKPNFLANAGEFLAERLEEEEVNCQIIKLDNGRVLELKGRKTQDEYV